jgi:hypothetical protein
MNGTLRQTRNKHHHPQKEEDNEPYLVGELWNKTLACGIESKTLAYELYSKY